MPAPLTATYVNFEPPDLIVLCWFGAAVAVLSAVLVTLRYLGRARDRRTEQQSAWESFQQVAKARGFSRAQVRALAVAARAAKLKRPAQIVGSVLVMDRCVDRAQDRGKLSETQMILLGEVRERLITTPEGRDPRKERRQLERLVCAFAVEISLIPEFLL